MSIFQGYIKTLKTFSWNGRASRKEFWMFNLITLILYIACFIALLVNENNELIFGIFSLILLLLIILTFIQSFTLSIRRLHDTNKSGWWLLIQLIPYIGSFILFIFYCLKGNKGDNSFGADPYEQLEISGAKKKVEELDALGNTKRHIPDYDDQNKFVF